jgi:hypothetical protein
LYAVVGERTQVPLRGSTEALKYDEGDVAQEKPTDAATAVALLAFAPAKKRTLVDKELAYPLALHAGVSVAGTV